MNTDQDDFRKTVVSLILRKHFFYPLDLLWSLAGLGQLVKSNACLNGIG